MQLGGVDAELDDHPEQQFGEQAGAVGVEQRLQRPTHPIVAQQPHLTRGQPEQGRVEPGGPLAEPVERFPAHQQIGDHQPHRHRRGQPGAGVACGQVTRQQRGQLRPVQEVVDQRQRPQPLTDQVEPALVSAPVSLVLPIPASRVSARYPPSPQ